MTTNRVGAFDPAILSRIHHAVNFGEPDSNQEERIWKMWLDRLHHQNLCDDYADLKDWVDDTVSDTRRPHLLSGREIRNIFIVAQILAEKEDGEVKITRAQVNSAYKYKKIFRHDTEKMRTEARALLADRKR
jgi:ATP-dependent 26S proteasome regulatory subunit